MGSSSNLAVAKQFGRLPFKVPTRDGVPMKGLGSLMSNHQSTDGDIVEVDAVRLDDFLGEAADLPNIAWIDVEGAIGEVIAGAYRTLSACKLAYIELETRRIWENQLLDEDVFSALEEFGLVPLLRDVQAPTQFNALFARLGAVSEPFFRDAVIRYPSAIRRDFLSLPST
ncbi:hypothetical protein DLJ53_34285 [Acuticoccus sediminis]|uniref:Methyltransferase FkbM domain-containing protein n=1 Tax=Acuticoccus sediminis TaxID=2184697 RepID=A0A8B2NC76_9HYPH|nr:FkbM family methyltransferase [Acuticoccus sediminis]RAH95421.1 hypothetical protein DLJ53_34285 [Acuticoccus sediminis]